MPKRCTLGCGTKGDAVNRMAAWSAVAIISTLIVVFFAIYRVGSCADAAPGHGESVCTSGPAIGVPGLWIVSTIGAVVVAVAVWQIVRARRALSR